jgi:hypothetical protein
LVNVIKFQLKQLKTMENHIYPIKLKTIIKEEIKTGSFDLMTRQLGQKIFLRIEKEIQEKENGTTVVLDFSGVGAIDYSCADEVMAKLVSRIELNEYGDKYIYLENLTPTQQENIHVALERKNLAILELKQDKGWAIIGVVNDYLYKTLEVIMKKGSVSSSELAEMLKLELNTASTRLINLHKLKLVKKTAQAGTERGKRHFIYKSLIA